MGGALIILSVCIAMLLWADLRVKYTWIALFVMLGFGVVGWIDDYRKLILKDPQGLRAKHKYALLSLVSLFTCIWLYLSAPRRSKPPFMCRSSKTSRGRWAGSSSPLSISS